MAAKIFAMQHSFPEMMRRRLAQSGQTPQMNVLPLEELRAEMLRPFGIMFRGPILVSVHPYGDNYVALHNFNSHKVTVWLEPNDKAGIEQVITLPTTANAHHTKTDSGIQIEMDPHTLTCFKIGNR